VETKCRLHKFFIGGFFLCTDFSLVGSFCGTLISQNGSKIKCSFDVAMADEGPPDPSYTGARCKKGCHNLLSDEKFRGPGARAGSRTHKCPGVCLSPLQCPARVQGLQTKNTSLVLYSKSLHTADYWGPLGRSEREVSYYALNSALTVIGMTRAS
jgi:hypothetical protein